MRVACLVDTTRCIGCRSCQVACKQSNGLEGERTKFSASPGGYQNPPRFSPRTFTYVSYHELDDADGRTVWAFVKHQCMHCKDMYCAYVCGPQVYSRTPTGVVAYQADYCIGCAACVDACPFGVPAIDYWNLAAPQVRKCSFCLERQGAKIDEAELDGEPLSAPALERHKESFHTPACAKACPTDALQFGDRDELLAEAKRRIAAQPDRYVDHVYGETEAGGTGWLYLARVPFGELGFPTTFENLDAYQKVKVG
ncbi:MAG TPA: 4Fe-4S dicluster domain-containing protein [Thermoguttaceae bacterium]|nr:4Fe-4S dicluster domain-containing protein [Thermoguttaceae bacterium]